MPEVIFQGSDGRLQGRYHPQSNREAPIAIILHPHPQFGGTMNHKIPYHMHYAFFRMGFSVMRFNFRGVGGSEGVYDDGIGELADAASALDYLQANNPGARQCWVAGFSFGAWIGMQLLMRRPEITGFISVAPPANQYDFSFLAPCPSSGLIVSSECDRVVPTEDTEKLVKKLQAQRGITITHTTIPDTGHFFEKKIEDLIDVIRGYVHGRLAESGLSTLPARTLIQKSAVALPAPSAFKEEKAIAS
jgi:uncharacterized protein